MKICFLTKKDKPGVKEAITFTKSLDANIDVFYGDVMDSFPKRIRQENYDFIISYLSPWIVPKDVLGKTTMWNINFHPGPPEYPGIGCFNFAIYESSENFGTTAHLMNPDVDTGKIIGVKRFPMTNKETVEILSNKTYDVQLSLYTEVMDYIITNNELPKCDEQWKRKPFKRSELEELASINLNMSKQELGERIRATYYSGKPAPFVEIHGYRFEYNPDR